MPGMRGRIFLLVALGLLACGAGTAQAKPHFEIEATRTLVWERPQLIVDFEVKGRARVETAPWIPCGGTPPGLSIVPMTRFLPYADPSQLVLADSEGHFVSICNRAPEISETPASWLGDVSALPTALHLRLGELTSCKGFPEEGSRMDLKVSDSRAVATPGSPAIQEVVFSGGRKMSTHSWSDLRTFCLVEPEEFSAPNRECAEFFDPDLCAKEYGTSEETLQMFHVRLVKTRTPACPAARAQKRRTERELRRTHPKSGRRYAMLLGHYRGRVLRRFKGECL